VLILVGVGGLVALAIAGYYFTYQVNRADGADGVAGLLEAGGAPSAGAALVPMQASPATGASWGGAWAADSRRFGGHGNALATVLDNRGERALAQGAPAGRQYGQTRSGFLAAGGRVAPEAPSSKWV
jgi:hypothetical protein